MYTILARTISKNLIHYAHMHIGCETEHVRASQNTRTHSKHSVHIRITLDFGATLSPSHYCLSLSFFLPNTSAHQKTHLFVCMYCTLKALKIHFVWRNSYDTKKKCLFHDLIIFFRTLRSISA